MLVSEGSPCRREWSAGVLEGREHFHAVRVAHWECSSPPPGENFLGEERGGGLAQTVRSLKEGAGRGQRESGPPHLGCGGQVRAGGQPRLQGHREGMAWAAPIQCGGQSPGRVRRGPAPG